MIRETVLRALKVPPEPQIPLGSREVLTFRAARNFYKYNLVLWALGQVSALLGIVGGLAFLNIASGKIDSRVILTLMQLGEVFGVAVYVAQVPVTLVVRQLDYSMRWYIVTDRSLRIREGVSRVREKTMTFANIQNMTIRQGPLQRLLGIADLEVRSAGGGAARSENPKHHNLGEDMHVAYFRGVDNGEEIRDLIRQRAQSSRGSGLGDPDEKSRTSPVAVAETPLDAAARELLAETRLLRETLTASNSHPR